MYTRLQSPHLKIAAFDLDHTLIKPKSGKKFPIDENDVMLMWPIVAKKIASLQSNDYLIVIFTNQLHLKDPSVIFNKIDKFLPNGKDIAVYISTSNDKYRKPNIGMFQSFIDTNGPILEMFYIGDAAGRIGDHSDCDIKFSYNCKLQFCTPEEYFLGIITEIKEIHSPNVPSIYPF
jgi:bifunctional polynucleotide phosphatase/kinase